MMSVCSRMKYFLTYAEIFDISYAVSTVTFPAATAAVNSSLSLPVDLASFSNSLLRIYKW